MNTRDRRDVVAASYEAARGDCVLALLLVLRMIWRGDLRASRLGLRKVS